MKRWHKAVLVIVLVVAIVLAYVYRRSNYVAPETTVTPTPPPAQTPPPPPAPVEPAPVPPPPPPSESTLPAVPSEPIQQFSSPINTPEESIGGYTAPMKILHEYDFSNTIPTPEMTVMPVTTPTTSNTTPMVQSFGTSTYATFGGDDENE